MAAAEFFNEGDVKMQSLTHEQDLEAQARYIDASTVLLQASIRGFFNRQNSRLRTDKQHSVQARNSKVPVTQPTAQSSLERGQKSAGGPLGVLTSNDTNSGKILQLAILWKIDPRLAFNQLDFRPSPGDPVSATPIHQELEHNLEQAAKHPIHSTMAPWWIENRPDHEPNDLCSVCSHISLDTLLHTTAPYMYEPPIPLGDLQTIAQKTNCALCRLLARLSATLLKSTVEILKSDPVASSLLCYLCDDPEWARCLTRNRQICLRLTLSLPGKTRQAQTYGRIQQILPLGERPPEQKFNDVRRVKDQLALDLIKSWIGVCEGEHSSTQLLSNTVYPSFLPAKPLDIHSPMTLVTESCQPTDLNGATFRLTVIDVKEECLVDVPPDVRYLALSYVWGGPQTFQNVSKTRKALYLPQSICLDNNTIPYTIRDAIRLVALLGERYLWVDSLCICQDDLTSKMKHIDNMGTIYSQAMLTIVAMHGKSADSGLPGVRASSRRSVQHVELVQNILLANELPHLDEMLQQSHWDTRGWTYQEKELSKRCLFFSDSQVYFRCNRQEFKEDCGLRDVSRVHSRALRIRGENHPIWNSYRRAVEGFTMRDLSFETDAINAFQGVARLFHSGFKGELLFGLPETELDAALLWQPGSAIHRRIDTTTGLPLFPSWSWAGWVGRIRYQWSKHLLDDQSRVEWKYTDCRQGHVGFCNSDEFRAPKSGTHSRWVYSLSTTAGTPYYYRHEEPNVWCLHPTATKDTRHDRALILPGRSHLIFKAYIARFSVSTLHETFNLDPVASCTSNAHILCPIRIPDKDGFAAGTVYLPGHLSTIESNQKYEFVCLSRRRSDVEPNRSGNDGRTSVPRNADCDFEDVPSQATIYPVGEPLEVARTTFDPRRYNMYKPWPLYNVMMIRRENDVAYRVAIGLIHVTAFLQGHPVKKLVTLA